MKVVIVSITRAFGGKCIGAIDEEGGSYRLLPMNFRPGNVGSRFHPLQAQFSVGEEWGITFRANKASVKPHVEDIILTRAKRIGKITDLPDYIQQNASGLIFKNDDLFERKLDISKSGSSNVPGNNPSNHSTCFWITPCALDRKSYYVNGNLEVYYELQDPYDNIVRLRYVGFVRTYRQPKIIRAGTLVRLSLSTLFRNCYWLQLSGWFWKPSR